MKTLDAANERLESTTENLRSTVVEASFRPEAEEPRSLLDFVDEQDVKRMRDKLKESIRDTNVSIHVLWGTYRIDSNSGSTH